MRITCVVVFVLVVLAQPAHAVITFTQLDPDTFVVSHRVKAIGSRAKAMKLVYTKAASLCVAAGFTHLEIRDQESAASQQNESANASVRVDFSSTGGDDRIDCKASADPDYIAEARNKLAKNGYQAPARPDPAGQADAGPSSSEAAIESKTASDTGSCTVAQIAAMVRAQLTDEQIIAACDAEAAHDD